MMKPLLCLVLVAITGLFVQEQQANSGIAGDWDVTYTDSEGTHSALMRLEQSGGSVRGTVRGSNLVEGVIEGTIEDARFNFKVRFYDSRRRLGDPTPCEATLESASMKGYCRQYRQDWAGKRRP
jgi:hypothetical protein